jgi:hypothetical protein
MRDVRPWTLGRFERQVAQLRRARQRSQRQARLAWLMKACATAFGENSGNLPTFRVKSVIPSDGFQRYFSHKAARAGALCFPRRGGERFTRRRCQGLRYYAHNESAPVRVTRRARKLWRRAGQPGRAGAVAET